MTVLGKNIPQLVALNYNQLLCSNVEIQVKKVYAVEKGFVLGGARVTVPRPAVSKGDCNARQGI